MIKVKFWKIVNLLVLTVALSGCVGSLVGYSTPEQAALAEARDFSYTYMNIDPASYQALQSRVLDETRIVLVIYQGRNESGQEILCEAAYEVRRASLGWMSSGGGSGCGVRQEEPISISTGSGMSRELTYSEVSGRIFQPEITEVEVEWPDGAVQIGPAINESYLVVREGQFQPARITAKDAAGKTLYVNEFGAPPEGKQ